MTDQENLRLFLEDINLTKKMPLSRDDLERLVDKHDAEIGEKDGAIVINLNGYAEEFYLNKGFRIVSKGIWINKGIKFPEVKMEKKLK